MTPEQINRAIAEYLGWEHWGLELVEKWGGVVAVGIPPGDREKPILTYQQIPDFFNDLNACHEMEETVRHCEDYGSCLKGILVKHWDGLGKNVNAFSVFSWAFAFAHATAPQRCEAFLKTVGKWKE